MIVSTYLRVCYDKQTLRIQHFEIPRNSSRNAQQKLPTNIKINIHNGGYVNFKYLYKPFPSRCAISMVNINVRAKMLTARTHTGNSISPINAFDIAGILLQPSAYSATRYPCSSTEMNMLKR